MQLFLFNFILPFAAVLCVTTVVQAGPILYAMCKLGCDVVANACAASSSGGTFGTTGAPPASPAIAACKTALALCALLFPPGP
ncbi:hypothetical protein AX14_002369 [Amanita brunnescens Koide BX004]|nr:hypothetical protein AX14_002369 [Amanita brunnescens Koide BX004]